MKKALQTPARPALTLPLRTLLAGLALGLVALAPAVGQTPTISTFAGTGTGGASGDGGAATSAQLNFPQGVAVDGSGNVYIADTFNHRIRRVSPTGVISTLAGTGTRGFSGDGGPATSAQLADPYGVAVDGSGNVYIADNNNRRIRRVSPTGVMSTFAGTGTGSFGGDGGPATSAQLTNPAGVAVDGSGNVYITDLRNERLRRVSPTGVISTIAGTGTQGFSGDGGLATSAQLAYPRGVAVDGRGNVYIADLLNHRIRRVGPTGVMSTLAGTGTLGFSGDGGAATSAQLNFPGGVAVDGSGNLYIADHSNHRIRRVTAGGTLATARAQAPALTLWPNPAPGAATLTGAAPHAAVQVLDALGRPVTTATADATGTARLVLPTGRAAGVYLVHSGAQVRRLVVE